MRYPLSTPNALSPTAIAAAVASLQSGRYTMGPLVEAFEHDVAQHVGAKHAVMVNSGSSANLLAVESLVRPSTGDPVWQPGDEILVPAVAWSTTVWPLVQAGLVPVFCDSDPQTLSIAQASISRMVSAKTRGMLLIHVLGLPADPHIATRCRLNGWTLVEDCCEAFGSTVGTEGRLATYSHFFSHQLSTMEGGTVTTDDDAIADDLRSMRSHGWTRQRSDRHLWESASNSIDPAFLFVTTGYNVRPLELQGAIGVEQLQHVAEMQKTKRIASEVLRAVLSPLPWLEVIGSELGACRMNLPLLVAKDAPFSRDAVVRALQVVGIETRPIIAGNLLRHPVMRSIDYRADVCPVADAVADRGFMVGCHEGIHEALGLFQVVVQSMRRAA